MDFKNNPIKAAALVLGGLVLVIMFIASISSSRENRRLKRAINENNDKIESLEAKKIPLLQKIKSDSLELVKKDSVILGLKTKEETLKNTIKYFKNENKRIKSDYINSSIDQRVDIFANLATRADSLQ
jgi:hypothetical protein